MKILLDAMGGDNAPKSTVQGAADAVKEFGDGMTLALLGDEAKIKAAAQELGVDLTPFELIHCTEDVDMHDDPVKAVRHKTDSSLVKGLTMLKNGEADAFVSAGSTGALHVGTSLIVRTIKGVKRPALATCMPGKKQPFLLLDCGANAECTSEYLLQFAYLGSYYAEKVLGIVQPRVGLLNIGAEPSKGDTLRHETYARLKEAGGQGHLNFIGNIEANTALAGGCDVIVADGYSGNIMLKSIEGTGKLLSIKLKEMLMHSTGTKLAALLLKGQLGDFKKMLDANEVGGTALLGISKPVVKAHGSASELGFCNAVRQAMAEQLTKSFRTPYRAEDIFMTSGACAALAIICAALIGLGIWQLRLAKARSDFRKLAAIVRQNTVETTAPAETTPPAAQPTQTPADPSAQTEPVTEPEPTEPVMLPQYAALYEQNDDLFGWLRIDGTVIDYPVMHTPGDPEKYLHTNFAGEYSFGGIPFIDAACSADSDNLLIYGHNMKDGTMFGRLTQYEKSIDYLKAHPFVDFSTLWHQERYVIFAVVDVSLDTSSENFLDYFAHPRFSSDAEFASYIRRAELASMYAIPMDVKPSDALLTLSTCLEENRLVVIARRQRDGESKASLRETVNMAVRQ